MLFALSGMIFCTGKKKSVPFPKTLGLELYGILVGLVDIMLVPFWGLGRKFSSQQPRDQNWK